MYEQSISDRGWKCLSDVMMMREEDLIACGINNKRHLRLLTTAIGALCVNQHLCVKN